jgi:hypothetical protein
LGDGDKTCPSNSGMFAKMRIDKDEQDRQDEKDKRKIEATKIKLNVTL